MARGDRRRSITIHENNKAVVAAFYNRCLTQGDRTAVTDVVAPDFVDRSHGLGGVADLQQFVSQSRERWVRLTYTIDDIIAEGDRVAVRWTGRGTHLSGREAEWTGMGFYRLRDGKIAERWANADTMSLARQVGTAPAGE